MGTPEYAPPEQYGAQPGHTDPRSDLYGLGATLYHALAGEAPLMATDRMAGILWFGSARDFNPQVSARTDAAIMTAMALRVADRFESAIEMQTALDKAKPPYRQQKHRPASRSAKWIRMAVGIILGALAFLLLVVGLAMAIAQL
jgi:serine/threonine protein kinase